MEEQKQIEKFRNAIRGSEQALAEIKSLVAQLENRMSQTERTIEKLADIEPAEEKAREIMKMDQCAEFLDLKRRTLWSYCKRGLIPYSKLGDGKSATVRFIKEDVLNALRQHKGPVDRTHC